VFFCKHSTHTQTHTHTHTHAHANTTRELICAHIRIHYQEHKASILVSFAQWHLKETTCVEVVRRLVTLVYDKNSVLHEVGCSLERAEDAAMVLCQTNRKVRIYLAEKIEEIARIDLFSTASLNPSLNSSLRSAVLQTSGAVQPTLTAEYSPRRIANQSLRASVESQYANPNPLHSDQHLIAVSADIFVKRSPSVEVSVQPSVEGVLRQVVPACGLADLQASDGDTSAETSDAETSDYVDTCFDNEHASQTAPPSEQSQCEERNSHELSLHPDDNIQESSMHPGIFTQNFNKISHPLHLSQTMDGASTYKATGSSTVLPTTEKGTEYTAGSSGNTYYSSDRFQPSLPPTPSTAEQLMSIARAQWQAALAAVPSIVAVPSIAQPDLTEMHTKSSFDAVHDWHYGQESTSTAILEQSTSYQPATWSRAVPLALHNVQRSTHQSATCNDALLSPVHSYAAAPQRQDVARAGGIGGCSNYGSGAGADKMSRAFAGLSIGSPNSCTLTWGEGGMEQVPQLPEPVFAPIDTLDAHHQRYIDVSEYVNEMEQSNSTNMHTKTPAVYGRLDIGSDHHSYGEEKIEMRASSVSKLAQRQPRVIAVSAVRTSATCAQFTLDASRASQDHHVRSPSLTFARSESPMTLSSSTPAANTLLRWQHTERPKGRAVFHEGEGEGKRQIAGQGRVEDVRRLHCESEKEAPACAQLYWHGGQEKERASYASQRQSSSEKTQANNADGNGATRYAHMEAVLQTPCYGDQMLGSTSDTMQYSHNTLNSATERSRPRLGDTGGGGHASGAQASGGVDSAYSRSDYYSNDYHSNTHYSSSDHHDKHSVKTSIDTVDHSYHPYSNTWALATYSARQSAYTGDSSEPTGLPRAHTLAHTHAPAARMQEQERARRDSALMHNANNGQHLAQGAQASYRAAHDVPAQKKKTYPARSTQQETADVRRYASPRGNCVLDSTFQYPASHSSQNSRFPSPRSASATHAYTHTHSMPGNVSSWRTALRGVDREGVCVRGVGREGIERALEASHKTRAMLRHVRQELAGRLGT